MSFWTRKRRSGQAVTAGDSGRVQKAKKGVKRSSPVAMEVKVLALEAPQAFNVAVESPAVLEIPLEVRLVDRPPASSCQPRPALCRGLHQPGSWRSHGGHRARPQAGGRLTRGFRPPSVPHTAPGRTGSLREPIVGMRVRLLQLPSHDISRYRSCCSARGSRHQGPRRTFTSGSLPDSVSLLG
jgi:hypothetical protein